MTANKKMAEKKILYSPPTFPEIKLSDEATRTRRNLIAAMAVWIFVVPLKVIPKSIALFGVQLENLPVSIPTLTSMALAYFWLSFIVYGYKDWKQWKYAFLGAADEQKKQVQNFRLDIEDGLQLIQEATERKQNDETHIGIKMRSSGSKLNNKLEDWKRYLPMWRNSLKRARRQQRHLWTDIILRSVWDYALPGSLIFAPVWYFLK